MTWEFTRIEKIVEESWLLDYDNEMNIINNEKSKEFDKDIQDLVNDLAIEILAPGNAYVTELIQLNAGIMFELCKKPPFHIEDFTRYYKLSGIEWM